MKLEVIRWTQDQLPKEYVAWLGTLPDQHLYESVLLLVHGSPRDPDEYLLNNDSISKGGVSASPTATPAWGSQPRTTRATDARISS